MIKVFIINGKGGVGKDQFIEYIKELIGEKFVLNISTVDLVKGYAAEIGWKGTKEPLDRKYLSDLKDIMTYWGDIPFNDVVSRTKIQIAEWEMFGINNGCVFIHCREPKEIERLVNALNAKTILIRRELNTKYINHADNEVEQYNYDIIIDNNGTLEELKNKTKNFVNIEI